MSPTSVVRARLARALLGLLVASVILAAWAGPAAAESWGGMVPGQTILKEVEGQYGRPTRERMVTEEGRTAPEWTYLGERAPRGLDRMVVSFGLTRPEGFKPDLLRAVTIYPKPRVFSLQAIVNGWGTPDAIGSDEQSGRPALRYDTKGLLIILDPTGAWAEIMLFAPPPPAAKP